MRGQQRADEDSLHKESARRQVAGEKRARPGVLRGAQRGADLRLSPPSSSKCAGSSADCIAAMTDALRPARHRRRRVVAIATRPPDRVPISIIDMNKADLIFPSRATKRPTPIWR